VPLTLTKIGPASANAGDDITYTLTITNQGSVQSLGTTVTDALPAGFSVLSATATAGNCTGVGTGKATCNLGALAPNEPATITILAHIPAICQSTTAVNNVVVTNDNCPGETLATASFTTVVNLPVIGPGACIPPTQNPDAGSVLLYGIYSSSPTNLNDENTRINITNTHPTESVAVHLFFVDGRTCVPADALLCLTPNQTASFFASDIDPGTSGYIVAVAIGRDGCPISFNFLIGSANVKLAVASSRKADLEAESIAAEYGSPLPGCNPGAPTVTLPFNGLPNGYGLLPRVLALDSIPSPVDGNDMLLIVNRFGGDMTAGAATIGSIFGILYDDAEVPHSFTLTGGCQIRRSLSNSFPRTTPVFSQAIPSGRTGWMKFWAASDVPIFGAAINYHPRTESSASAFGGGHNLHKLTLTTGSLTIPIIPPPC
jgi:uncharacterized repeat protein (TIGR01451 family)